MQILFGKDVCRDFGSAAEKEWLETNGIGGFASSTIIGANTRRYHGLLTAATGPPLARHLLLSRLEEVLLVGGERYELSSNRYGGAIHPRGYLHQEAFRLDPFPTFYYRAGDVEVEKQVFMVHGENTTVVTYAMTGGSGEATLEVRPLIAFRDYHGTTHENSSIHREVTREGPGVMGLRPYPGLPALYLGHDAEGVGGEGWWYRDFWYPQETERGLDDREDLFSPCELTFRLRPGEVRVVIASTEVRGPGAWRALREEEVTRRRSLRVGGDDFAEALTAAADAFLIRRGDGLRSVIAGYPWFGEWGRDAMIALPGLTLVTGRFEEARSILEAFARHGDRGMIPNRFPDYGETPDYNTADATLWMFHAVDRYLAYTGDGAFVREALWPTLVEVVKWHVQGTRYGIGVAGDGLLRAGEPGAQLTWMDAKVGDWVVTPRHGKAVEINALWYNALRVMEGLARRFGDEAREREYSGRATQVLDRFEATFWNEAAGCLYDVVDGDRRDATDRQSDAAIRPNQIFAVSLPHAVLTGERARRVVEVVRRDLLTPVGLRSLSPGDAHYCGRFTGDVRARDGAYHQGTVWAWLIGPFISAYVKAQGRRREAREEAQGFLSGLHAHLMDAGLGSLSEVFDGDPPHLPKGCTAQAWSVAEALRAYVEDVLDERPED